MAIRISQPFSISESSPFGKLNRVNDAYQGGSTVDQARLRAGMLGYQVELPTDVALQLSGTLPDGTANPILYGGWYQYVQLISTSAAVVQGQVAFCISPANGGLYRVSSDSAVSSSLGKHCGIFLNVITPGNFGWIQVGGLASLQFVTAITNEVDGNGVMVANQAGSGFGQQVTATAVTNANFPQELGVAAELPVDNTITRIWYRPAVVMT